MARVIFLNGKLLPAQKAEMGPGLSYGLGLFETMRSYNYKVFCLDEHINRLRKSCATLNLSAPSYKSLEDSIKRTLKAGKSPDSYVRLNVWKAENGINTSVIVKKFDMYKSAMYKKGFKAILCKYRVDESSPSAGLKTMNYLNFLMARKFAERKGFDEAILLNTKGDCCEGSRTNIFLIRKNVIYTPSLDSGCIEGIARRTVLRLAHKKNIKAIEKKISLNDFKYTGEAFITNSLMEIMPLVEINNTSIGNGKPGVITKLLLEEYRRLTK